MSLNRRCSNGFFAEIVQTSGCEHRIVNLGNLCGQIGKISDQFVSRLPIFLQMCEKLVNFGWRMLVLALIAGGSLLASTLIYQAVLSMFGMRWQQSLPTMLGGVAIGLGVWLLCMHRNDLICG